MVSIARIHPIRSSRDLSMRRYRRRTLNVGGQIPDQVCMSDHCASVSLLPTSSRYVETLGCILRLHTRSTTLRQRLVSDNEEVMDPTALRVIRCIFSPNDIASRWRTLGIDSMAGNFLSDWLSRCLQRATPETPSKQGLAITKEF